MSNVLYCERVKVKKWIAIAGCQADCIAEARDKFKAAGYPNADGINVSWKDSFVHMKCYIGESLYFKEIQ